jgi:hypothetical protein
VLAVNNSVLEKTVPTYPRFNVPASEKVIRQAVVPQVTAPETVSVPVEMVIISSRAPDAGVVALIVSEAQETVPAPIASVTLKPALGLGMLIAPPTVSAFPPLIVTMVFAAAAA